MTTPSHPSLLWVGPASDHSGHADEVRGFLRALERAGDAPALHELTWTEKRVELTPQDRAMIRRQTARRPAAPVVAVHTYLPFANAPTLSNAINVHRAMFETDRLPAAWLAPLLQRDEVWVPCRHNYEAFADSGIPESKLRILGGTLDFDLYTPDAEPLTVDWPEDRFTFLTNFDFSARKGWEVLLRAWGKAFDESDPVCLVLKTGSFYRDDNHVTERIASFVEQEFGARAAHLAPIHLMTDRLSAADMPRLYAAADAYVLASRGEGWGRPFMEAQAMGLPTIASSWGGQTEFMDDDTSWLVDGELIAVPDDAELFNGLYQGHRWFDPDVDALAAHLTSIAADPEGARRRAAPARQRLIDRFGEHATVERLRALTAGAVDRFGDPTRPACVYRGTFGSSASLPAVNDGLAAALETVGRTVGHRAMGADGAETDAPGITLSWPPDFTAVTNGPTVMMLFWEYGAPPAEWVENLRDGIDRLWAASEYLRERFIAGGVPAGMVDLVPLGIDPERFRPDGPALELPTTAACTFLFVGGTIWRKGVDLLLDAWTEAFGPDDDVALVIKDFGTTTYYRGQTIGDAIQELADSRTAAPIVYLDHDLPARDVPPLYRAADVLVTPYRGEGFCLPALEAMACGLPVIHTATGPTGEFVPPEAGWAVPAVEVPMTSTALPPLAGEGHVQEVDRAALVEALRAAARDRQDRERRGAAALAAASRMTWAHAAEAANASLHRLEEEGLPLARDIVPESLDVPYGQTTVLYAPDWSDEQTWAGTLARWVDEFSASDPVTLVLAGTDDGAALAQPIQDVLDASGRGDDVLPDLMLYRDHVAVSGLVASVDAVLVDGIPSEVPELTRRAALVHTSDLESLRDLRASLSPKAGAPV